MLEPVVIYNGFSIAIILCLFGLITISGRVEHALGIFLAIMFWAYNVQVGATSLLWISVYSIIGAAISSWLRKVFRRQPVFLLNKYDLVMLLWSFLWGLWMYFVYRSFPTPFAETLFKNLLLYCLLPLLLVILLIRSYGQIGRLINSYMATTIISGFLSIGLLSIPLTSWGEDSSLILRGFTGINYLTFAIPFAITVILGITKMAATRSPRRLLALGIAVIGSIALLVLTGSRQSALGVAFVLMLIAIITVLAKSKRKNRTRNVLIILGVLIVGMAVLTSTRLRERWLDVNIEIQPRMYYWKAGLATFLKSPVKGNGFDYMIEEADTAHNLIIDTMASQGLVGLFFLVGFLGITLYGVFRANPFNTEIINEPLYLGSIYALIYTLIQTSVSGGLASAPHLFWICALIHRFTKITPNICLKKRVHGPSKPVVTGFASCAK